MSDAQNLLIRCVIVGGVFLMRRQILDALHAWDERREMGHAIRQFNQQRGK